VAALRHSSKASSGKDVVCFAKCARTRRYPDWRRDGRSSAANWYTIAPRLPPMILWSRIIGAGCALRRLGTGFIATRRKGLILLQDIPVSYCAVLSICDQEVFSRRHMLGQSAPTLCMACHSRAHPWHVTTQKKGSPDLRQAKLWDKYACCLSVQCSMSMDRDEWPTRTPTSRNLFASLALSLPQGIQSSPCFKSALGS
jgi:hypothetical protein